MKPTFFGLNRLGGFQLLQGNPVEGDKRKPVGPPPLPGELCLEGVLEAKYAFA